MTELEQQLPDCVGPCPEYFIGLWQGGLSAYQTPKTTLYIASPKSNKPSVEIGVHWYTQVFAKSRKRFELLYLATFGSN